MVYFIYAGFHKKTKKLFLQVITEKITEELKKKINIIPLRNALQICITANSLEEAIEKYKEEENLFFTDFKIYLNENILEVK